MSSAIQQNAMQIHATAAAAISSGLMCNASGWLIDHLQVIGALLYVIVQLLSIYVALRNLRRRDRKAGPGAMCRLALHLLKTAVNYLTPNTPPDPEHDV